MIAYQIIFKVGEQELGQRVMAPSPELARLKIEHRHNNAVVIAVLPAEPPQKPASYRPRKYLHRR